MIMDKWLFDLIVKSVPLLITGLIVWVRLSDTVNTLKERTKLLERRIELHETKESPHVNCPVHSSVLEDVQKTVEKIDHRLDMLDQRLFSVITRLKVDGEA
jgi:hypothetical protein